MVDDPLISRRVLGRYEIRQLLGAGGMGRVYLAEHVDLGERCAVKVLLPEYSNNAHIVGRFVQEARLASMLRHDHIVKIIDAGQFPEDGLHYLVMEFLEGMSLEQRLCQWGWETDLDAALSILLQICSALAKAHGAKEPIVHRDLKPDNVFVVVTADNPAFVKVLDFGIAKLHVEHGAGITGTGAVMGTPSYMAPEQMVNSRDVDARADIYAMGVIAYRMFTGKLPFQGGSIAQIALAHHAGPPPDPRQWRADLPPAWADTAMRALALRPEDRPQSVRELAQLLIAGYERGPAIAARVARDLQETAGQHDATTRHAPTTTSYHTAGAVATVGERPRHRQPGDRRWLPWALGAVAIAALGIGAAYTFSRSDTPPAQVAASQPAGGEAPSDAAPQPAMTRIPADAAAAVSVWIRTEPDGAQLIVNGAEAGPAPQLVTGLPGDPLVIEARRDGHEVASSTVTLSAQMPDVRLSLPALPKAAGKRVRPKGRRAPDKRTEPAEKPATSPAIDPSGVLR